MKRGSGHHGSLERRYNIFLGRSSKCSLIGCANPFFILLHQALLNGRTHCTLLHETESKGVILNFLHEIVSKVGIQFRVIRTRLTRPPTVVGGMFQECSKVTVPSGLNSDQPWNDKNEKGNIVLHICPNSAPNEPAVIPATSHLLYETSRGCRGWGQGGGQGLGWIESANNNHGHYCCWNVPTR